MNNYEKIKNRTIEEVAEDIYFNDKILDNICKQCMPCPYGDDVETYNCKQCIMKWLQQEV